MPVYRLRMVCLWGADGFMVNRSNSLLLAFWTKRTLPALAEAALAVWAMAAVAASAISAATNVCLPLLLSEVTARTLGDQPAR